MGSMNNVKIAKEAVAITKQGFYEKDGKKILLGYTPSELKEVKVFTPKEITKLRENCDLSSQTQHSCQYIVVNMDSYAAAQKYGDNKKVLVMNFANAHNPGGGFLNGASAQEESLCRCSTLYESIGGTTASEMYDYNKAHKNAFNSEYLLISPNVAVFRQADGALLDEVYKTAVITIAAPNKRGMARDAKQEDIDKDMCKKIKNVCVAAGSMGYDTLVLGAWGCGAFAHDAKVVAKYFREVLVEEKYDHLFKKIIFAVYDRGECYNYKAFVAEFQNEIRYITPNILKSGKVLLQLKHNFLTNRAEQTLIPVLGCLHDSQVVVPMSLTISDEDKEQFINSKKGDVITTKNNIKMKPDILRNGEKFFFPIFSNQEQLPAEYANNFSAIKMPVLQCIEMAKTYPQVIGLVLDAFTEPMVIEFDLADIILKLPSRLKSGE